MKKKAIIFDLDDTLYDCTGFFLKEAIKNASKVLEENGFPEKKEVLFDKLMILINKYIDKRDLFSFICDKYDVKNKDFFIELAINECNNISMPDDLKLFDGVEDTLKELKKDYRLFLVSEGKRNYQDKKIDKLGVKDYFDEMIILDDSSLIKADVFKQILDRFNFKPKEVLVVGDKITSEISCANKLGILSVQFLHGRQKKRHPKNNFEKPDYKIKKLSNLFALLKLLNSNNSKPSIVCIGGGTGVPNILRGLKYFTPNLSAVIGVTDSGRSSGRLRQEIGILPPGDIRNCLVALSSESSELFCDLFQHRFDKGSLKGHSLGNLILAGLSDVMGCFNKAISEAGSFLNISGNIFPTSLYDTHLCCERENGEVVIGEDNIVKRFENSKNLNPIKRIFLRENTPANIEAVNVIKSADCIILGPGSHYTSVLNNLLHKEIRDSINENKKAKKIYIANIMTQPFQTDDFKLSDHLNEIERYLAGKINYIIANSKEPSKKILDAYRQENSFLVEIDKENIKESEVRLVLSDILEDINEKRNLFEKRDSLRHDSEKIAAKIIEILVDGRY